MLICGLSSVALCPRAIVSAGDCDRSAPRTSPCGAGSLSDRRRLEIEISVGRRRGRVAVASRSQSPLSSIRCRSLAQTRARRRRSSGGGDDVADGSVSLDGLPQSFSDLVRLGWNPDDGSCSARLGGDRDERLQNLVNEARQFLAALGPLPSPVERQQEDASSNPELQVTLDRLDSLGPLRLLFSRGPQRVRTEVAAETLSSSSPPQNQNSTTAQRSRQRPPQRPPPMRQRHRPSQSALLPEHNEVFKRPSTRSVRERRAQSLPRTGTRRELEQAASPVRQTVLRLPSELVASSMPVRQRLLHLQPVRQPPSVFEPESQGQPLPEVTPVPDSVLVPERRPPQPELQCQLPQPDPEGDLRPVLQLPPALLPQTVLQRLPPLHRQELLTDFRGERPIAFQGHSLVAESVSCAESVPVPKRRPPEQELRTVLQPQQIVPQVLSRQSCQLRSQPSLVQEHEPESYPESVVLPISDPQPEPPQSLSIKPQLETLSVLEPVSVCSEPRPVPQRRQCQPALQLAPKSEIRQEEDSEPHSVSPSGIVPKPLPKSNAAPQRPPPPPSPVLQRVSQQGPPKTEPHLDAYIEPQLESHLQKPLEPQLIIQPHPLPGPQPGPRRRLIQPVPEQEHQPHLQPGLQPEPHVEQHPEAHPEPRLEPQIILQRPSLSSPQQGPQRRPTQPAPQQELRPNAKPELQPERRPELGLESQLEPRSAPQRPHLPLSQLAFLHQTERRPEATFEPLHLEPEPSGPPPQRPHRRLRRGGDNDSSTALPGQRRRPLKDVDAVQEPVQQQQQQDVAVIRPPPRGIFVFRRSSERPGSAVPPSSDVAEQWPPH